MIGEIGYIGKLADDIDRSKMALLVHHFINSTIFENNSDENHFIKGIKFNNFELADINKKI